MSRGQIVKALSGFYYVAGEDGSVLSTSFSVREDGGLLTVTLKAQCREQIGREVTFAGQVGEIIPGTQEG